MPSELAALTAFWAPPMIGLQLFLFGKAGIIQALGFMSQAGQLAFTKVDLPKSPLMDKLV
jgi:hypothetical protein